MYTQKIKTYIFHFKNNVVAPDPPRAWLVAMLLCTTCTLPFLMSFNRLVRKLSMSILFEMLLGREFHALS